MTPRPDPLHGFGVAREWLEDYPCRGDEADWIGTVLRDFDTALARVEAVIEAAPRLLRWVELVTQSRVGEGRYAANDDMFELDGRELYNLMHAAEPLAAALAALSSEAGGTASGGGLDEGGET